MLRKKRRWYTASERSEMWDRWQRGESLNVIARAFETSHSAISKNFDRFGGIRPPDRQRSRLALTLSEREEISRGVVSGLSLRTIARQLDRAPSTISREINRNGGLKRYRANHADKAAWDRAHRPKPCKLAGSLQLRRIIAKKLKRRWSPEQIAGWLKKIHADNEKLQVSHETIYRSLFIQARGVLKRELLQYLRTRRVMRCPQKTSLKGQGLGQITDAVSIRERPPSAEDRAVPGHWEGDLICGSKNSFIATLVERHTRYVMLAKVSGKDTEAVISALIKQARKLPVELYKSLTWDRGSE
ncbi:MAG: IS30 family transposase, partial [Gammaproteobacteria bacterium]